MNRQLQIASLVLLATLSGACSDTGFGRFEGNVVGGPSCMSDFMPFESAFQTAQDRPDSIVLFFQSDGGTPAGKDFIQFTILSPSDLELGTAYSLEDPLSPESSFVGQISLTDSCPDDALALYLTGEFTLNQYKPTNGSAVTGTFADGAAIDADTGEVVIEEMSGSWDFTLNTGPPYEAFP